MGISDLSGDLGRDAAEEQTVSTCAVMSEDQQVGAPVEVRDDPVARTTALEHRGDRDAVSSFELAAQVLESLADDPVLLAEEVGELGVDQLGPVGAEREVLGGHRDVQDGRRRSCSRRQRCADVSGADRQLGQIDRADNPVHGHARGAARAAPGNLAGLAGR